MKKIFHNYDIINQHIKLYLMIWEQKMREYIFDNITVDDFDSFYEVMKGSFPSIEMTSFKFILVWVPEPVCHTCKGN